MSDTEVARHNENMRETLDSVPVDSSKKQNKKEGKKHAKFTEYPEDFNQLELLETHGHLIPKGARSLWPEESEDDWEETEEEMTEEEFLQREKALESSPEKLILWAAEKNRLSTIKRLLSENRSLINSRDGDHYTPLHRAAYNGHLEIVRELVGHGADVHAVTVDGWTPLHSACKWNNTKVASFLLQHGADINAQTEGLLTPLHLASGNREGSEVLELLLMNRYLKPELKNSLNETALDIAKRSNMYHYLFEIVEPSTNSSPEN